MIVKWRQVNNQLVINFTREEDDPLEAPPNIRGVSASLGGTGCYFSLPDGWSLDGTHSDLLAAAAMMIVEPFTGNTIRLPEPVSRELNEYFYNTFGKRLEPVSDSLKPRRARMGSSVPALAFSGGVDSMAASILMPRETIHVFVDREDLNSHGRPTKYNKSAALRAIDKMSSMGHKMVKVPTDYEFVRSPTGFTWGVSSAAPIAILADFYNFDSIAFGMILESAYGIGDNNFQEHWGRWQDFFGAIGLNYNIPTAGLSEIMTTKIVLQSPEYTGLAQSCIRGLPGEPCLNCLKCFRKLLAETAIKGEDLDSLELGRMARSREIYNHIIQTPIHHENIYTYALTKYKGEDKFLLLLSKKVRADKVDVSWMDGWYQDSESLLYDKYKTEIKDNIAKFTKAMSPEQVVVLRNWKLKSLKSAKNIHGFMYRLRSSQFVNFLDKLLAQPKV